MHAVEAATGDVVWTNEKAGRAVDVTGAEGGISPHGLSPTGTMAASDEVFFSGAPLTLSIGAEQTQASSLELYQDTVSGPIIQSICIECHVSGGQAQGSALTYLSSSQQNYLQTNYNTLVNYIKNGGSTNILAKPSGATGHGGGTRLPAGSSLYQDFEAFVSAVLAE